MFNYDNVYKVGIRFSVYYHISEDESVVTAVAKPILPLHVEKLKYDNCVMSAIMKIQSSGIARLKFGDESDIEVAKNIARKKAIRKAYRLIANIMKERYECYKSIKNMYGRITCLCREKARIIDNEIIEITSN